MWPLSYVRLGARAGVPAPYHPSFSVSRWVASSTATPGIAVAKAGSRPVMSRAKPPRISTLSSQKLTDADSVDVSGKSRFNIRTPFGAVKLPYYGSGKYRFPPDTRGFLYFTAPPAVPSIRFRIVDGGNSSDFDHGRDLLLPNGLTPWNVSQNAIVKAQRVVPLRRLLAHEGSEFRDDGSTTSTAQWPQTLDPARLTCLDTVMLSGKNPYLDLPTGRVYLAYTGDHRIGFPEHTRGFLYFDLASLSVRFRILGGHDVIEFKRGSDLLLLDGRTPWCISFHRVASWNSYAPIREQLLLDNLVSKQQIRSHVYVVSTLDHTRLTDADLLDLSGLARCEVSVAPADREMFTLPVRCGESPSRFPIDARGFLYWHVPEENPYDAELRFRRTESLERFAQGHDLWMPGRDRPWSLRLRGLARQAASHSRPLLEYLKQAGLADESVINHHAKTTVTHMRDVFLVRFRLRSLSVRLRVGTLSCHIVFRGMPWVDIYSGAALARLVVLDDTQTTVRLGLRIVTMLDGPRMNCDGKVRSDAVPPKVGHLVPGRRYNRDYGPTNSWSTVRSLGLRKSSKEGKVLLKIMGQSGDDMDTQRMQ
ncbi:hypothetical protein BD626DRAFT_437635 [Schizophyllum amplum]|uniref:Uncharacterized protein n=1 Tax=Schizophyllum amplum TaxID=97359 RepID=A0A550C276_9AGAR|nr:hypothetical protein BD626DRAFT_437635 [Auriculariopsis ampla]